MDTEALRLNVPSESQPSHDLLFNIQYLYSKMPKTFRKISDYLLSHPMDAERYSITQLAGKIGTNASNITRYCQAFGYSGFAEFKYRFSYTINIQHLLSLVKLLNPRHIHRNVRL